MQAPDGFLKNLSPVSGSSNQTQKQERDDFLSLVYYLIVILFGYSYLNASTGFSFEAL
jgi:hypothetical protein